MPQLDFFTFTHQFLFLSLSFYGLYYFNLLVLFPEVRWQFLENFFFLWFLSYDIYYFNRWALGVITMGLTMYWIFLHEIRHINYLKINNFFFSNVSSVRSPKYPNLKEITFVAFLSWLMLLFFFKNILVFNAEKLMFIYFIQVVIFLIFLVKNIFSKILKEDINNILESIIVLELWTEYYTCVMTRLVLNINKYLMYKTKLSFLLNVLKTKQISLN